MKKLILVALVCLVGCEFGDVIKVVTDDGQVCGCMYDNTGFQDCREGTKAVVISTSKCK